MTNKSLRDFNRHRQKGHLKDEKQEDYLLGVNKVLQKKEISEYLDLKEEHPTIFVFGLPRSGTTFITQLIAHSFDVGYINNFMARFWLAPVTGINLSRIIYGSDTASNFSSNYATTLDVTDIHEYGYFWREHLKKDHISDILSSKENEAEINWEELKKTILNIHHAFGKGWICKNIFGAYHLEKISRVLEKAFFVYIERDPLDVAISILDARNKFYSDPEIWWSTVPYEYNSLKDLPVMEQIAGQVYYLGIFYNEELKRIPEDRYIKISYQDASTQPEDIIQKIKAKTDTSRGSSISIREEIPAELHKGFRFRTYDDRQKEKEAFRKIFAELKKKS